MGDDGGSEDNALTSSEKQTVTPPISPFSSPIISIPDFQQSDVMTDLKMDTPTSWQTTPVSADEMTK